MSIHDSLAEALSTSLTTEELPSELADRHKPPYSPKTGHSSTLSPEMEKKRQRRSSALSADIASVKSASRPNTRDHRSGSVSSQAIDIPEDAGSTAAAETPIIVVRSASTSHGRAASTTVPEPRKQYKRKSWASNLLNWRSNDQPAVKTLPAEDTLGTPEEPGSEPHISNVTFEPRKSRPSISKPNVTLSVEDDDEEAWRYGNGKNSPAFTAIVLATRLITPDAASVVHRPRSVSTEIAAICHDLVAGAQESGANLKKERGGVTSGFVKAEKENIKPPTSFEPSSEAGSSQSLGSMLTSRVQAILNGPQSTNTARNQLLRSLSTKNNGPFHHSGARSPDRTGPTPPMLSPTSEEIGTPAPSVELNAFTAPKDRPPTMLPRRNTFADSHRLIQAATRFGDDTADIEPYTDRYGFVYDLGYVKMLLELKSASAEVAPEMPDQKRVANEVTRHNDVMPARSGEIERDSQSNTISPSKASAEVNTISDGHHNRARASTSATFNPSPAKASSSQQDILISSRGSQNLRPTTTSGSDAPDQKGSLRAQKARLDKLASRHSTPVSALLSRLSDVHDVQEKDTLRKWEQFLKYRKAKSSRRSSIRQRSPSVSESGSWQGDLIGIANMGSGKTGQDLMKKFMALVHDKGIPIGLRPDIWSECSGAKEAYVPGEYHEILAVHEVDKHPILGEIEKDVKRTFPTNVFFGGDGVGCEKLRRVLTAFAWHDPSIGYCQGMNLVAATLLLIYQDEERAYWTFVAMVRNLLPEEWFAPNLQGSMVEQAVLEELIAEILPKTAAHFESIGLEFSAVTFGWMLSLFTSCLPIEVCQQPV